MATWTTCNSLAITLETGSQDCFLYANGLNSVKVVVSFVPVDENKKPMTNWPDIGWGTKTILVDYINPTEQLGYNGSSGWVYSTTTDPAYHNVPIGPTMSEAADGELAPSSAANETKDAGRVRGMVQYTAYIRAGQDVSSTKSIGLRLTTDGGKVYYCAMYPQDDQYALIPQRVVITPLAPINYDSTNTKLDRVYASGHDNYYQDNYYFYINQSGFKIVTADFNPSVLGPVTYASCPSNGWHPYWHFAWSLGESRDVLFTDQVFNVGAQYNLIGINSRGPNTVTLTRLDNMVYKVDGGGYYNMRLQIYDQYGNTGHFSLVARDRWDAIDVVPGDANSDPSGG